jgi:hypothetical protein
VVARRLPVATAETAKLTPMVNNPLQDAMRSPAVWFVVLVVVGCLVAPYVLGVPPKTARQRACLALTIAFLAWVLPLMASLR